MYKLNRFLCHLSLHTEWYQGCFFFQLCNWFQLFWCEQKIQKLQDMVGTFKNDLFERRCRWLQLFFNDFQLFYFLRRIIAVIHRLTIDLIRNRIRGLTISVLASSLIVCGFDPQSGQRKDCKIGICCFFAKHGAFRSKSRYWLDHHQDILSEWSNMSLSSHQM